MPTTIVFTNGEKITVSAELIEMADEGAARSPAPKKSLVRRG